ncbi:MAG: helix-turn-helix domain-containing protein [Gemmatimonadetes bacterium]|nr:helix-turn-helix domain-containing protein [Gemmatimonadota bacterium]
MDVPTVAAADVGPANFRPARERVDVDELEHAWRVLRLASDRFDLIARGHGWPVPFGPVRVLILARLANATSYGLSARQLKSLLGVRPSTMAYHLDALVEAGLVFRAPWTMYDRRKVAVRLTVAGRYAAQRLAAAAQPPPVPPMRSPAMARP